MHSTLTQACQSQQLRYNLKGEMMTSAIKAQPCHEVLLTYTGSPCHCETTARRLAALAGAQLPGATRGAAAQPHA